MQWKCVSPDHPNAAAIVRYFCADLVPELVLYVPELEASPAPTDAAILAINNKRPAIIAITTNKIVDAITLHLS